MAGLNDRIFKNKFITGIIAVFCAIMWGSTAPSIKMGMDLFRIGQEDIFSQIFFAGVCFTISGIILLIIPFFKSYKSLAIKRRQLRDTIFIGLVQTGLQYVFLYIGISNTTGFKASVLSSSGTFFILIIAHFIYKNDKLNLNKALGCILGFIGILILSVNEGSDLSSILGFNVLGDGFVLLSTLSFVVTTPACKRLGQSVDPTVFTGQTFIIGGIALVSIGALGGVNIYMGSSLGYTVLIYLGVSSGLAGALWNYLLKYNNVSSVSIYNFLVPIFGAAFSSVFLHEEVFGIKNLLSLALTCLGIAFVNLSPRSKKRLDAVSV